MAPPHFGLLATLLFAVLCSFTLAETEIHLQWAICDRDNQTVLHKLGKAGKEPYKAHDITYYDTSPPSYTAEGLAFRTKFKNQALTSVVKARFDDEVSNMPASADCVWDKYGESVSYTCGLAAPVSAENASLWSEEQKSFAGRYHNVTWDKLVPFGPFKDPKWKMHIKGYKAKFDDVIVETEFAVLHIMEIEVKVKASQGPKAYKKISKYLKKKGVVLCDSRQLPKTARLFEFLESQASSGAREDTQTMLGQGELR